MVEKCDRTAMTVKYKLELNERLENTELVTKLAKNYGVGINNKQNRHNKIQTKCWWRQRSSILTVFDVMYSVPQAQFSTNPVTTVWSWSKLLSRSWLAALSCVLLQVLKMCLHVRARVRARVCVCACVRKTLTQIDVCWQRKIKHFWQMQNICNWYTF